ncbi:MAG: hypothetical protein EA391_06110 [Balneolaceae bacterium]|nr:MAG: hypothetical protein EA391_06110 [Balneolaceae bacterium]
MNDLLKAGQVLGREEMKNIMAGSGNACQVCTDIAAACYQYVVDTIDQADDEYSQTVEICKNQADACLSMC